MKNFQLDQTFQPATFILREHHNDNGSVIPIHRNYVDAVSDKVKGLTYVPLNNFGGAEAPVTMWLDA